MSALRIRISYADPAELTRALDEEIARGVLLARVAAPEALAFRDPVSLEIEAGDAGSLVVESEVVSILPDVGVVLSVSAERAGEVRALHARMSADTGPTSHEIAGDELDEGGLALDESEPADDASEAAGAPRGRAMHAMAEKVRLARHGTREDRAKLLRDPNRTLHALVIKCPQVTVDEVAGWAKNAQLGADFLRQIADRKDWLSRPNVAQGLVRNPKTPAEVALRALDYVGTEAMRSFAKGAGVPPYVAAAARKKALRK